MRKVKFKRWIPVEYTGDGFSKRKVNGTGCHEQEYTEDGLFHSWGTIIQENSGQIASESIALIELTDGTVSQMYPNNIKFIDPPQDLELCYSSEGIKPIIYFKDPKDGK